LALVAHSTPGIIREVLTETHTWAVVGCSPDPSRDSHRVARFLQAHGYRVIPVNPMTDEVLGERCYATVADIPADEGVEVVDIFRRADRAGAHVDEAIAAGARAVWLQLDVVDEAAAQRAGEAGLQVVMDRCPAIELGDLRSLGSSPGGSGALRALGSSPGGSGALRALGSSPGGERPGAA
jgi:predicted CoA-binding protein